MGWRHIDKPQCIKCTKALVAEFAGMEPAPNDRELRPKRQSFIKSEVEKNTFRLAGFASCKCKETGKLYRVNGKHTSMVLSELNGHFPKELFATVERYEADTLRDVAELYSTYDRRESIRTTNDINKAFAAANPDLAEIQPRILSLAVTGMSYSLWEDGYSMKPVDVRAALALDNPTFVMWLYFLFGESCGQQFKMLRRGAVVAAMFGTWKKAPKKAEEFWQAVRDEAIANRDDPTRTLARYLREAVVRTLRRGNGTSETSHAMYSKCIHAWNAWRGGEATSLKYYADKPTPSIK
jgi:hypothetical protein